MKKFFKGKVGSVLKGLVREGLQTLPVIGTIVTNLKTDTKRNPKGKVKLEGWDWYRLVIGIGVAWLLYKGWQIAKIKFILEIIGL